MNDAAHLELAVLDCEGEATLDQIEGVVTELVEAPALKDAQILPYPGRQSLQIVRTRNEARRDARFFGPYLEKQFQQVGDQRTFLR